MIENTCKGSREGSTEGIAGGREGGWEERRRIEEKGRHFYKHRLYSHNKILKLLLKETL